MGLVRAAGAALSTMMGDQWREYFYCNSLDNDTLILKGEKRIGPKSSNTKGADNIISNGALIAVNDGQCMIIVEQGAIVEVCAEPGEFVFDSSTEPSIFYGDLGENLVNSFKTFVKRFAFGGDTAKDQRIYYFNTKEIIGNKYGTANPVPFRVLDKNIDLDIEIALRAHGEFTFRLMDPILFYKNLAGNVEKDYKKQEIESQLRSELLTKLQPAFARIAESGVRYYQITAHTDELGQILNELLSKSWGEHYGIEMTAFGISSVTAPEEDIEMIKQLQKNAVYRNATMAAANLTAAQADAMRAAASNESTGPMMAFAGMNMANQVGGFNAGNLYAMGAEQQNAAAAANANTPAGNAESPAPAAAASVAGVATASDWTCPKCGHEHNNGKFCSECGTAKTEDWTCPECGHTGNKGKFCSECGHKKD
ncbi:SPFH domain-containing protein [Oribacterium parvum]|uniref:SPFH domain-containing protein n=2 Tax=Oribacterium parvum TaxID=1501329 RepID=UPI0028F1647E|nr:SPFH domain-containing protein [Oribacterium parvum]